MNISRARRALGRAERRILAMGPAVVEPLLKVLRNWRSEEDGIVCAVAAARMLGSIGDPRAVPGLLEVLSEAGAEDHLVEELIKALTSFGPPIVEALLVLERSTEPRKVRDAAAMVLAQIGVRDDRILAVLLDRLAAYPGFGATLLAPYGDPAALPALHRALGALDVDDLPRPMGPIHIMAVAHAIESLGGELSPSERYKQRNAKIIRGSRVAPGERV